MPSFSFLSAFFWLYYNCVQLCLNASAFKLVPPASELCFLSSFAAAFQAIMLQLGFESSQSSFFVKIVNFQL